MPHLVDHRPRRTHRVRHLAFCAIIAPVIQNACLAQDSYRRPPAEIIKILEAPLTPTVSLDPKRSVMLLIERENMPPIAELARPMLRLAGSRINPQTNGPFNPSRLIGLTLQRVADGSQIDIKLPEVPGGVNIGFPNWAPDGKHFAFTITRDNGIELWLGDAQTGNVRQLTGPTLNAAFGSSFDWMPDSRHLVCRFVPDGRGPAPNAPAAPMGPVIQETLGVKAPVRTHQDMLKDAHDEALFEHYMTAQLAIVDSGTGKRQNLGSPALYNRFDASPSGKYIVVSRTVRPYSYLVSAGSFAEIVEIWDRTGKVVREFARLPLRDNVPIEGVPTGPRGVHWRANTEHDELFWTEALDEGDPNNKVPHRDKVMSLAAPFAPDQQPLEVLKVEHRFRGLNWLQAPSLALLGEYDRDRRWSRTWLVDLEHLDDPTLPPRLLWDRSVNDRYGDPGRPSAITTAWGRSVVLVHDNSIYLEGNGATPEGDRPFLDKLDLDTFKTSRVWQCRGENLESIVDLLSPDASAAITRYESPTEPQNYYVRHLDGGGDRKLTNFADPAPELRDIRKELVTYRRDDGVQLSATLYLPPNYREGDRLPLIVWAYPREFNDADTAGQVSGSPYRFTRIEGISHLFLLTQGYAIMDNATMPVVGDPETMNDTFILQIVASAKACIEKAAEMGVADPNRVGVGGHSYGAFMTANLLAHCDLFKAGVARSGAYNRTLTPFGFQSERRTLWEAPDAYIELSPFMCAHKINEPLLLIHGQMDDNSGTFPIQSERLFQAVKGNGGRARLVMLPHESHGYRARESVMHTLAEMVEWFDEHVKYVDTSASPAPAAADAAEAAEAASREK